MEPAPTTDPDTADGWYRLGNARQDEGRDDLAAECFEHAVRMEPGHARAWNNLGASRHRLGGAELAAAAYRRALAIEPTLLQALVNLAHLCREGGDAEAAEPLLARASALDPSNAGTWEALGRVRVGLGRHDAALESFRAWLECDRSRLEPYVNLAGIELARGNLAAAGAWFLAGLEHHPADPTLRHMLAAVRGEAKPLPAAGYVEQLFDGMAREFDVTLQRLGYRVPEMLARAVLPLLRRAPRARVLDLGCGTGLLGAALAPAGAEITGVDLSAEMLQRAAARGVYARLVKGELVEEMRSAAPGTLDAVLAADVFVYLGDLESVFEAAVRALATGGVFAFSVEALESGDFALRPSGRYAHSAAYLRALAARCGLAEHRMERNIVRIEHGVPVEGWLASFTRR
jgi:predicted TPR repeat methyltransferase